MNNLRSSYTMVESAQKTDIAAARFLGECYSQK